MRENKKMSIREIAKLSNVSVATVSRVLNNNGRFSEETKKRVQAVIDQYGYTANVAAKSLRECKSKTIGVIVPDITNELFAEIVLEIEKFFFDKGYSVFFCNTNEENVKEREYFKSLNGKAVAGIICISGREDMPTDIIDSDIPVVCIDRKPKTSRDMIYVESDHYFGGYIATEELIKKGCRKILILSKQKALSVNTQRLQGYLDALKDNNIEVDQSLIVKLSDNISNFDEARDIVFYMIKKGIEFDGIFATNDWRAYGALVALNQNNISVPEQVKIVGFDGISVSKYCYPPITTISQNKKALAVEASNILFQLITTNEKIEQKIITIPVSLVIRGTT